MIIKRENQAMNSVDPGEVEVNAELLDAPDSFVEDDSNAILEEDSSAEDWDSYESSDVQEDNLQIPVKKKSFLFNTIIIAGAVVAGLGFLYLKAGPSGEPSTMQETSAPSEVAQNADIISESAGQADGEETKPQPATGGLLNDPTALHGVDAAADNSDAEEQPPQPVPTEQSEKTAPETAELTPLPSSPDKEAEVSPNASQSPASSSAPAPFMKAANPAETTETPLSNDKIDQLLEKVTSIESRLSVLEAQPAQESLDAINARLTALESRPVETPLDIKKETPVSDQKNENEVVNIANREKSVTVKDADLEKTSVHWVLKSAQPGQAYISRSGQNDMISVHIGDTLAGIGKVTSIDVVAGHWVVQGTSGSISQ